MQKDRETINKEKQIILWPSRNNEKIKNCPQIVSIIEQNPPNNKN